MSEAERPRLLSDDELRRIFERRVRPTIERPSQDTPRVLILGGTQGSRKTTLAPLVARQLGMEDAVIFDGDRHYAFHPAFERLAQEQGATEARLSCLEDVKALRVMMKEYIREQRADVVMVGPWTKFEFAAAEISAFREHGYQAEAAYTAMHPALSQLGVAHRHYQVSSAEAAHIFTTSPDFQRHAYDLVPQAIHDAREHVHAVHVVDATGVVYSTHRQADDTWVPSRDPREVIEEIRHRPWDAQTQADFRRRRAEIDHLPDEGWAERLASIDEAAALMLAPPRGAVDTEAAQAARLAELGFPASPSAAVEEGAGRRAEFTQESSGQDHPHESGMEI